MFGKRKHHRLERAITVARAALDGQDEGPLDIAYEELLSAYVALGYDHHDPAASELLERLRDRQQTRDERQVQTTLTACPCCGGGELLLADHASIDAFYVGPGSAPLKFMMVVCTRCGDIRMRTRDIAAFRDLVNIEGSKCFAPVSVPARSGPFR
jgi:ribosomal protein S27AE